MSKKQEEQPDIIYEETDELNSAKLKKLKEELKKCKEEKQEYLDGWQRLKADFINQKKRHEDEKAGTHSRALENFIYDLLPTIDSFEIAFKNKEAWESAPEQWRKGIEYIYSQLQNLLTNYGVKEIYPIGKDFNHDEHNSIETIEVEDEKENGKVVEVVLKGYKLKDSLIRPANVKVGKF